MPQGAVTVRPAAPADADFVFRVTEACMRGYAEQTFGRWDEALVRASFASATHRIIRHEGHDIGCIALIDEGDHTKLDKLYILPACQNRGSERRSCATSWRRPLRRGSRCA